MLFLGMFLAGLFVSYAMGAYTLALTERRPLAATFWDFATVALGWGGVLSAWETSDHSVVAMMFFAAGNAVSTYFLARPK